MAVRFRRPIKRVTDKRGALGKTLIIIALVFASWQLLGLVTGLASLYAVYIVSAVPTDFFASSGENGIVLVAICYFVPVTAALIFIILPLLWSWAKDALN